MKFWQKAFLGILLVFIISINTCLFLISRYSYSLNLQRDTDRALGEYHFISNSVNENMSSLNIGDQSVPANTSIESFMRSYADYYSKQDVYLELWDKDNIIFSNIPSWAKSSNLIRSTDSKTRKAIVKTADKKIFLYITGKLDVQFENYSLIYVRDLTSLQIAHTQLTKYLIYVSAAVEVVLALVLIILLKKLTFPIRALQKSAGRIAEGNYDERINLPGKDEFHEFADTFNKMSSRIQEHVTELDKTAQDKQTLVDNLAHELRTPLTAIRGYAEYLQNANASEEHKITAAGYILSETKRMQNLAFKLLDLALTRNAPLDLKKIYPLELLKGTKATLEDKLKNKNIELELNSELNELTGDYVLLQSLLVNLVDNAIKASKKDSLIRLSAYFDHAPVITVQDFGCGMWRKNIFLSCVSHFTGWIKHVQEAPVELDLDFLSVSR